jgi:hypothetical protein
MAKQDKLKSAQKGAAKKTADGGTKSAQADGGGKAEQDAVALLENDHRTVEGLFSEFESASDSASKGEIARKICIELMVHTKIEEELFYPACRENEVDADVLDEAQVEHDGAKVLISELLSLPPDSDYYDAKVNVLSEYIRHHVAEEEKEDDGIFAKARASGVDLEALGAQLRARKQKLAAEMGERARPPKPISLFVFGAGPINKEYGQMGRMGGRDRHDQRRFMSDDDDGRYGGRGRSSSSRERDEHGRFMSDDDRGGNGHRRQSSASGYSDRDDRGRFMSDDDRGGNGGRFGGGSFDRDEERDYSSRSSRSGRYEDDDQDRGSRSGSGRSRGRGSFGDREAQSQASQRGWDERDSSRSRHDDDYDDRRHSRGSSRADDDEDDRRSSRSGGRGHGGWFGDPEGHSQAAQRGWEERGSSSSRRDNDDHRRSMSRSRSRSDDDDEDRRSSSSSRGRSQGHGGWFGDSRGHAEAARRGWQNRD